MSSNDVDLAALYERLANVSAGISELKNMIGSVDRRVRDMEIDQAGRKVISKAKNDSAHRRLDELDLRVKVIEECMPFVKELLSIKNKLIILVALSGFGGTAVGALVIAYLSQIFFGS